MRQFISLFILLIVIAGCQKEDIAEENSDANNQLLKLMQNEYLWYDHIPDIDPNQYTSPYQLINHLRYSEKDKWSFVMDLYEYESLFLNSKYIGFGFGIGKTEDGKHYISVIFNDSPAYHDGVRRGWQITKINNTTLTSTTNIQELLQQNDIKFSFIDPNGTTIEKSYSKKEVKMNTVVHYSTKIIDNKKIGYMVFHSFLKQSEQELNQAFQFFKAENITDLIIDFRYNGGGMLSIANQLANLIAGNKASNEIFTTLKHNNKNSNKNSNYYFSVIENSLEINNLVVITTSSSASASEVLINGVKPVMPVTLIGQTTHGKPVGMYIYQYDKYIFAPICFATVNKNNEGDFFNGIPVNYTVGDDITKDFGDNNEECLKAALEYLTTGAVSAKRTSSRKTIEEFSGLHSFISAY